MGKGTNLGTITPVLKDLNVLYNGEAIRVPSSKTAERKA
jgi:hypothetical protein